MRKVLFKRRYNIAGKWEWSDYVNEGLFHQWANGYEEFEIGPGNFTYGIVELPDGTIEEVFPTNLKFV